MNAREEILRRVSDALVDVDPTTVNDPITRSTAIRHPKIDLVDLFCERVEDYRATVRRVPAPDVGAAVADVVDDLGISDLILPPELRKGWTADLADLAAVRLHRDDPLLSVADIDQADAVLTGCAVGIAETGTVVLDAGPDQGRRLLTLLPDVHICVVRSEQIVADVPNAIETLDPRRPLTWISGPSATSDIELDRVEGVHGPRTLVVIVAVAHGIRLTLIRR